MKIALIGYGAMGKLVGAQALERGHEVFTVIRGSDEPMSAEEMAGRLAGADTAIDFSVAGSVRRNAVACLLAGVPLVEGTTGWNPEIEVISALVGQHKGSFVYGANFSVGVNLFYRIVGLASELFSNFDEYEAFLEERHHSRKKDAPSGTALKLRDVVARHVHKDLPIASTRAGNIPGTHIVGFDGPADTIELKHTARSREGFAAGAILAAEWIAGRKGFYEFSEVMDEILKGVSDG